MDRPPAGATDTYLEDLLEMLRFSVKVEAKLECDAVVWAGDVFHHKQPSKTSHATVLKMIEIVKSYRNLYIVPGNHDISNDRLESIHEKQPLGVLYEAGAKKLDGWAEDNLPLYGVPWQQDWAEEIINKSYEAWRSGLKTRFLGEHALAVTHCPIYPPHLAAEVIFDLVDTSLLAEAMDHRGSLYYGHIHENHGVFEVDGVSFANMGALSRGSLHEYNINRPIQMALWIDGVFKTVNVPHKPAEEVLKVQEHLKQKEAQKSLAEFLDQVGSASIEISSTASLIHYIKNRSDIDPEVRERATTLIESMS